LVRIQAAGGGLVMYSVLPGGAPLPLKHKKSRGQRYLKYVLGL